MSKLTLQYEGIALKDYAVGAGVTIGRLPDNAVIIDNPAVSGHHARVFHEGNRVILEDLRSTNGTFVNGRPVTRHVLQHGDEVLVGKHQIMFDQNAAEPQPVAGAPMQSLGDTVYLDTKQHRALRATLESARADAAKPVHTRAAVSGTISASTRRRPARDCRKRRAGGVQSRRAHVASSGVRTPRSSVFAAGSSRRSPSPSRRMALATWPPRWEASRSSTSRRSKAVTTCRKATC